MSANDGFLKELPKELMAEPNIPSGHPEAFHDAFAAEHGSWNRANRTGYQVIRVPLKNATPTGEYEDFVTGFVTPEGRVWGRPVGIAQAPDGSLLFSDDQSNSVWRVAYEGAATGK